MQFISSSLDKLVKDLSDEDFMYLVEEFGFENLVLLKQKGAYPNEYMNSFERFKGKRLPARNIYLVQQTKEKIVDYDKKLEGHISFKDYLICEKVWDKFDVKDMGGCHNHYLKKDLLLLADVLEKIFDTGSKFYRLDLFHYLSSSGLSWDAMVKMAGVKLEKISDIGKYLFIEKGLRRGISYIAKRYAKANKKYINDYDSKILSTFITYLDMNNLYGWGQNEYLAYGRFN